MGKNVIIDPEWEEQELSRRPSPVRPQRTQRPEDLDPFGVDDQYSEPPWDTELEPQSELSPQPEQPQQPDHKPQAEPDPFTEPKPQPEPQPEPDPFTEPDEDIPASKAKEFIGMILSGSILTAPKVSKNYPYLLLIALLMFIYISSLFRMHQLYRREIQLTRQVSELRAKSLGLNVKIMTATRQSYIMEELARREIPLTELLTPPKIIEK